MNARYWQWTNPITCRSMSSTQMRPVANTFCTAALLVPYKLPANSAFSRKSPRSMALCIVARSEKLYASPSTSPGRGFRVVCDTLKAKQPSLREKSSFKRVLLPDPEGPQMTRGRMLDIRRKKWLYCRGERERGNQMTTQIKYRQRGILSVSYW